MKKLLIVILLISSFSLLYAEETKIAKKNQKVQNVKAAIGILNGGGGIVGVDLEFLLRNRISFQIGVGYVSFGAGFNIHMEKTLNSSFFNIGYWHQGLGNTHAQSMIGPSYVWRWKYFQFQLGFGYRVIEGPYFDEVAKALDTKVEDMPKYLLLYSIAIPI